jgi:hypothetical protein
MVIAAPHVKNSCRADLRPRPEYASLAQFAKGIAIILGSE